MLDSLFNVFSSPEEVALSVAAIKKEAKNIAGSCYLIKLVK